MKTGKDSDEAKALDKVVHKYILDAKFNNVEEGVIDYDHFLNDRMLIIQSIRRGLPYYFFEQIRKVMPFDDTDWAQYLNVSLKTLQRHQKDNDFVFKPIHSEKIIELAEVAHFGKKVFGSSSSFSSWLDLPSRALGDMKPSELLNDSYGKELVMDELNRIEHGIFA